MEQRFPGIQPGAWRTAAGRKQILLSRVHDGIRGRHDVRRGRHSDIVRTVADETLTFFQGCA